MALKYSDLIKQYDGEGDFAVWIEKLEMVAKLQNVKEWCAFLPLFLSEDAFSVYKEINEDGKKCYHTVKKVLLKAFSKDQFSAYDALINRKWRIGESVDAYFADIKRMITLVNQGTLSGTEEWVKCAFVNGLPENSQRQLKILCSLGEMEMEIVLEKTRNLLRPHECHDAMVVKETNRIGCFRCGKQGHISRYCSAGSKEGKMSIRCYLCNSESHLMNACPKRFQTKKND